MNRPEFELIEWIQGQIHVREPVELGIGDDAASLRPTADREQLVAIDMLMEGVHFTFPPATPELAGRKALAVNLSDIAAMAGRPTAAFVSVALPRQRGMDFARRVHTGVIELATEFDVILAGGDTNIWDGPLVISVTVMGEPHGKNSIRRSGARPGDWLLVTGSLGGSLPSQHHLTFTPRLKEARDLSEMVDIHAMMDISDGLAADLHHLLKASQVGAVLQADQIPISRSVGPGPDLQASLMHALSDGEDFELLLAIAAEDGERLLAEWRSHTPITKVGEICEGNSCQIRFPDGRIEALEPIGWTHRFSPSA